MTRVRLPVVDASSEPMDDRLRAFASTLRRQITGDVAIDRATRLLYATDASIYQVTPLAVVIPASIEELDIAVRCAAAYQLPVVPRGGGTSLAGQTVNHAVVIDVSRSCTGIVSIDPRARTVVVEPGIVLNDLNDALEPHGLFFGPDVATATHANIGGMIGNNSAGARSVVYGRTADHVLALDVLLADGTPMYCARGAARWDRRLHAMTAQLAAIVRPLAPLIRRRYPGTLRHVNGYALDRLLTQFESSPRGTFDAVNLAHLLCGSEGTLAVTRRAMLQCVDRPRHFGLAIIAYGSVDEALAAVMSLLSTGPTAVELIDDAVLHAARGNAMCAPYVDRLPRIDGGDPRAVMYVEYAAPDADELCARLHDVTLRYGRRRVETVTDAAAMRDAWTLRTSGEPLLCGMPGDRKTADVHRGSCGRSRRASGVHPCVSRVARAARHPRRLLRARLRGMSAHPATHQSA